MDIEDYPQGRRVKIVLFGLPISTQVRLKAESNEWADAVPAPHAFRSIPLTTNSNIPFSKGELDDLIGAVDDGFTHVVIPGRSDWKVVRSLLRFDCRVHTISIQVQLRKLTWEFLRSRLHEIAALDQAWLAKISPTDLRHALLLPPTFFKAGRETIDYWNKCEVYTEHRIADAERVLQVVEREHRKPDGQGGRSWIDDRKWRYRFDLSKHGISPPNRAGRKTFRFCYEVLQGFHYDVMDDSGGWFFVDINSKRERLKHCNVTPWGRVWRG
jgi:hypothetical protein